MKREITDALALWREAEQLQEDLPADHPARRPVERVCREMRELHRRLTHTDGPMSEETIADARLRIHDARAHLAEAERRMRS